MEEYYWDTKLDYLKRTRDLYYNDDYIEFLVKFVWKLTKPVNIVDFGCGYGYLGHKLLPLLPDGSTYTGIDKGKHLISRGRELFHDTPYETTFIVSDMNEIEIERTYDIAVSHAFLLHMSEPKRILQKMMNSVVDGGKIICFEPHWISGMSSYYLDGYEQSQIVQLGMLQKLYEKDAKQTGKDGNIGAKLPQYLSDLGVKNIDCRVSDKVNYLNPDVNIKEKEGLFHSLKEDGVGDVPENKETYIASLVKRGVTLEEAQEQYDSVLLFAQSFHMNSSLVWAPGMKITFGEITSK
ncbi:SAM-dependent methyltransferase [Sporosarcina luteola]|nr:SAM-dependent methyltransferase [Sporosarcina luteola]